MELPDDVQDDLRMLAESEAKVTKKTLHQAVDAMDRARKTYEEAVQARGTLHSQWKNFLAESIQLWQNHATGFQAQEAQLTDRIKQAKDSFAAARDAMAEAKSAAAQLVPTDGQAVEVSDEEELRDVPMAAAERITAGLTNLTETMTALHSQAEELVQEEQRTKRPRMDDGPPAAPGGGQATPAVEPSLPSFGPPGGQ